MNSGTPFYTTSANPMYYTNTSCLAGMVDGDSCQTIWQVNASGMINSTWEFYVIYEAVNYSSNVCYHLEKDLVLKQKLNLM